MHPVSGAGAATQDMGVGRIDGIKNASQEFEALLLKELLSPLQETFATVPGEDPRRNPTMSAMGTEYLALGLARAGGLGIAHMIAGDLSRTRVTAKVIQK